MIKNLMKHITGTTRRFCYYIARPFQHVFQIKFRITADGNDRITADGNTRITADSDY